MTLGWQFAFFIIASDPLRFRPMMLLAMYEKFSCAALLLVLFARGHINAAQFAGCVPDLLLGLLFVAAFMKTRPDHSSANR